MIPAEQPDPLDQILRDHLDREAAAVDPAAMLARVRSAVPHPVPRPTPRRRWRAYLGIGAGIAIAASLGLFLLGGPPTERVALASATEVLQEAKTAQERTPTDRCYAVSAVWEVMPFQKKFHFRPISREGIVWTRGDQFVVQSKFADGGGELSWGQEAGGRVWIAANRKQVLVFEADEVGEPLLRFCELMSLRLASTLGELLEKHDLSRRDGGQPGETIHIEAHARKETSNGSNRLDRVELFLNPDTKVVERAILSRQLNGELLGKLEFTLLDSQAQPESIYTPQYHTEAGAVILDRKTDPTPKSDLRSRLRDTIVKRFAPKN